MDPTDQSETPLPDPAASPGSEPGSDTGSRRPSSTLRPSTLAVAAGRPTSVGSPLNHPLVPASNFRFAPTEGGRQYSRNDSTEPWEGLEEAIGALEGGVAVAFASGMAAVSAILDQLDPNVSVVVPSDCYQGVAAIVTERARNHGWAVHQVSTDDHEGWMAALETGPGLVWLESPSNPLLQVADVGAICARAAELGLTVAVDNTFATPLLQQPLTLGATYSVHSATKFIGGHSDLLAGVVACVESARDGLVARRALGGATPGALEAFLALRGLRTLPVRLERSQETAARLAERLEAHPSVTRVHYPGLPSDPGHDLAKRTLAGPGAMISFQTTGTADDLDQALGRLRLVASATSLGGVESTIERRNRLAGQEAIPPTLLRLSVGLEHLEDLWADLAFMLGGLTER